MFMCVIGLEQMISQPEHQLFRQQEQVPIGLQPYLSKPVGQLFTIMFSRQPEH